MKRFNTSVALLVCVVAALSGAAENKAEIKKAETEKGEKKPWVIEGWGTAIDPDGDCKIEEDKGILTITVPGTLHDLFPPNSVVNAPRVMKEVEGDFSAQVKVVGSFDPGNEPVKGFDRAFHSAGLLVWQDEKNYTRYERGEIIWQHNGLHLYYAPLCQLRLDGKYTELMPAQKMYRKPVFKDSTVYLRLDRKGDVMTPYLSKDGKDWKKGAEFKAFSGKKVQVGIAALNTSSREFKVFFEHFKVTTPEKP
jgi:regulation of enolase protein 1 (concanavalin A-like superfamily)